MDCGLECHGDGIHCMCCPSHVMSGPGSTDQQTQIRFGRQYIVQYVPPGGVPSVPAATEPPTTSTTTSIHSSIQQPALRFRFSISNQHSLVSTPYRTNTISTVQDHVMQQGPVLCMYAHAVRRTEDGRDNVCMVCLH